MWEEVFKAFKVGDSYQHRVVGDVRANEDIGLQKKQSAARAPMIATIFSNVFRNVRNQTTKRGAARALHLV